MSRRSAKSSHTPSKIPSACRECGVVLRDPERQYCRDCLPKFKDERTGKLVGAARLLVAQMRASADDPALSTEAKGKRVATNAARREAALRWERENPGPYDPEQFRAEVLPGLAMTTLPQMMRATGLTSGYCWRIRRGERTPHAMYWEALRELINMQS
jgi:hypothetical protein